MTFNEVMGARSVYYTDGRHIILRQGIWWDWYVEIDGAWQRVGQTQFLPSSAVQRFREVVKKCP